MADKAADGAETRAATPASKRSDHEADVETKIEPKIEPKSPKQDAKQRDTEIKVSPEAETPAHLVKDVTEEGRKPHPKGCVKEPCPAPSPTPVANKPCTGEYCHHPDCPNGSAPDKGGVCRAYTPPITCPSGYVQSGAVCVMASQATVQCGSFQGRGEILAAQLRNLRLDIQRACSQDPSGDECIRLKQRQSMLLLEYQGLLTEAPAECHSGMPTYVSLM